jgi:hypothetical protein
MIARKRMSRIGEAIDVPIAETQAASKLSPAR